MKPLLGLCLLAALILLMQGCVPSKAPVAVKPFSIECLMREKGGIFDSVLKYRKEWNVQVIYTRINRDAHGQPLLTDFYFNTDSARYFYPASTIKLPVVLLALEKINNLGVAGLSRRSVMITDSAYSGQSVVYNDPTSANGAPSIEHYIKKILLVSDNDAYNRLYEFLGREYINKRLHEMGYQEVQVLHRLSVFLSQDENKHTNPVRFYDDSGHLLYQQPMLADAQQYETRQDSIGIGYMVGDQIVKRPMDFSLKNRISLKSLHQILKSVFFPEAIPASQRFGLTADDLAFVRKYMSEYPTESKYPYYDTTNYYPAYCKYIFFGAEKKAMPGNIRIFNKVGNAYSEMIDVVYFVDFENKIEFMLSAAIYCNKDGILNDDRYDYDETGLPFLKKLGETIYEYELNHRHKHLPSLDDLRFLYVE
jgi:hypothetical protein